MSEFSDQKLRSAARQRGRKPYQPAAAMSPRAISGRMPAKASNWREAVAIQAVTMSGATPSSIAGRAIRTNHAATSFGRLISASRLPAIATRDRFFVLLASSSASPDRGSMRIAIAPSHAADGSHQPQRPAAWENGTLGIEMGQDDDGLDRRSRYPPNPGAGERRHAASSRCREG